MDKVTHLTNTENNFWSWSERAVGEDEVMKTSELDSVTTVLCVPQLGADGPHLISWR